jgi:hypothetical protein
MARDLGLPVNDIIFNQFAGINNVDDPVNLTPQDLVEADNVDIDNQGRATRRPGYTKKYIPSGQLHSMWSNDRICLFVDGTTLMRLLTDYTATTIRTNISSLPVDYDDWNETVYYTNASVIGYIVNGVDQTLSDPGLDFKDVIPPGQHITYYNGRIYVAKDQTIWYTDAYALNRIDMRKNVIQMKDEITMMKAVDDGIYVSIGDIDDRSSVIFLGGTTPEEFTYREVADYGAIEGTGRKTKGAFVGDGVVGDPIMWISRKGICIGANGGSFRNLTAGRYEVPNNRYGAGQFRLINGIPQYISTLWS